MSHYYNENDARAAAWLRELMARGCIPAGVVDTRSITEVKAHELAGHIQCHFFAGIGGWPYALQLAGWPVHRQVWTGSCPCQPFSVSGKRAVDQDERHLWPAFRELIAKCRPPVCFGEQVAARDGKIWFAGVRADLEALGFVCGASDLCAAGVGAPHIRQRIYWGACPRDGGWKRVVFACELGDDELCPECGEPYADCPCPGPTQDGYEYTEHANGLLYARWLGEPSQPRLEGYVGHVDHGDEPGRIVADQAGSTATTGAAGGLGESDGSGWLAGQLAATTTRHRHPTESAGGAHCGLGNVRGAKWGPDLQGGHGEFHGPHSDGRETAGEYRASSAWRDFDFVLCRDAHARRIEPGTFPLADGIPARVGRLRGYGNAICAPLAAEFIRAFDDATHILLNEK